MDLLRTLSNPDVGALVTSLSGRLASGSSAGPFPSGRPASRRARFGSIDRAVLQAVELTRRPASVSDLHVEVERLIAGTVNNGSVKSSLARLASTSGSGVKRVSRGSYVRELR